MLPLDKVHNGTTDMNRREFVLAAMAPAKGAIHTPVQIQKLLFLLDDNLSEAFDGPHFDFQPYDYGPFDKNVYATLDELSRDSLVEILETPGRVWRRYRLTLDGQSNGDELMSSLSENAIDYLGKISKFVRTTPFAKLVSAIYKAYPDMKKNSVFQG